MIARSDIQNNQQTKWHYYQLIKIDTGSSAKEGSRPFAILWIKLVEGQGQLGS